MPKEKNTITYKTNPRLPILKKNWKGNVIINGKFHNSHTEEKPPLWEVLKWKLSLNPQRTEKKLDKFKLPLERLNKLPKTNSITWLGHSSFLISINGVNLITDPIFFDLPLAKRKIKLPLDLNLLRPIDYLLISHDHRDHLDLKSIKTLTKNNPQMEALIPLKISEIFNKTSLKNMPFQEAGWYQKYNISRNIDIILLPAQHWGRRNIFDFNKRLWGSFLIIANNTKIFFSGDTAHSNTLFKKIKKEFGNMDICLLPIGTYSPKSLMQSEHLNPKEAIQVAKDLDCKNFIPMHYGTYDLSDEPLGEPLQKLKDNFTPKNKNLHILKIGESLRINSISK